MSKVPTEEIIVQKGMATWRNESKNRLFDIYIIR